MGTGSCSERVEPLIMVNSGKRETGNDDFITLRDLPPWPHLVSALINVHLTTKFSVPVKFGVSEVTIEEPK